MKFFGDIWDKSIIIISIGNDFDNDLYLDEYELLEECISEVIYKNKCVIYNALYREFGDDGMILVSLMLSEQRKG